MGRARNEAHSGRPGSPAAWDKRAATWPRLRHETVSTGVPAFSTPRVTATLCCELGQGLREPKGPKENRATPPFSRLWPAVEESSSARNSESHPSAASIVGSEEPPGRTTITRSGRSRRRARWSPGLSEYCPATNASVTRWGGGLSSRRDANSRSTAAPARLEIHGPTRRSSSNAKTSAAKRTRSRIWTRSCASRRVEAPISTNSCSGPAGE